MTPHFPIYMDYGATTPVDPRVVDAMIPWLREHFGNPASRSHAWGWEAEEAVEKAREQVADADRRRPARDRLDLRRDRVEQPGHQGRGALLQDARQAPHHGEDRAQGGARHHARAGAPGLRGDLPRRAGRRPARPGRVQGGACAPTPSWSSVMFVNNEIGVIQDIPAIGAMCREKGIIFHVDAAQATGKVEIDLQDAAGRPDEPGLAQDLRPQGHRRAVRAPQAARAARSADARRRPRARHALGHAAHAPDRRHGRGLPHRQAPRWAPRATRMRARCSSACSTA